MTANLYTEASVLEARGTETGRDRYNQPVYGPPTRTTAPCWYTHKSGTEDTATGELYVTGYLIQWPPEFYGAVQGSDTVVLDIGTFQVVGEPLFQPGGLVVEGYVQATLERTSG